MRPLTLGLVLASPAGTPTWALFDVTPTTAQVLGTESRCDWMDSQGWPWD